MHNQAKYLRLKEDFEKQCRELVQNPEKFAEYLRFSGRFYKLPPSHTMAIMAANPNSTMVADYDTWQKYHRQVMRGFHGIPVAAGGKIGYYFDISATSGKSVPYQWSLDKETATKYIEHYNAFSGKQSRTFSGCIDRMSDEAVDNIAEKAAKDLEIPRENFYAFKSSFASMIRYNVAARCEWGGSYKYKSNPLDLSALKMIKPEDAVMYIEFVQMTSKTVLLQMEKEINVINAERSIENERARRNQTDMVRGGQDVLPRIQDGERKNVQTSPEMVRVSGGVSADTRTGGTDERTDRTLGQAVAEVYGGNVSRTGGTDERLRSGLGVDTPQDRQAGTGTVRHSEGGISTENSSPDNVHGNIRMGGNVPNDVDTSRGNGTDISAVGGRRDFDRSEFGQIPVLNNEEDNSHKEQKAEVNSPAFSVENLPTITCVWSESSVFEDGKTYSVYEFDRLMKQADDERVAGTKAAIEKYGSFDNWYNSNDEDFINYMGYDKVKFTLNLPNGTSFTERQDIGDGYGGVIDFLSQYSQKYGAIIPLLEQARDAEKSITESEKSLELPDNIDKFYINKENESVTWVYFNPDSDNGGQLVYNHFTFDQLFDNLMEEDIDEALTHAAKTELVDIDNPAFKERAQEFLSDNEDFSFSGEWDRNRLSALVEPRYGIFQLKSDEKLRDYRFVSADTLKKHSLYVDRENYNGVYRGRLKEGETLEDIYQRFNIDRPEDFQGHSLSVSDIICIKNNGTTTAYYVDKVGFTKVPDFMLDREERKARRTLTDNLTLLAENQLASDEMDDLGDKLFDYDNAPKYSDLSNSWKIGAGLSPDDFENLTSRYNNGEDIRAELAQKIYGNMSHIEFFEFPPADGIGRIDISTQKTDSGMTFRTKGGFEITHSWETLGDALITAARQEFDRHEELDRYDRQQREQDNIGEQLTLGATTTETNVIDDFKSKTAENFAPIGGLNSDDIEADVRSYVQNLIDENEIDAQIVDLAVVGSRSRNLGGEQSDLDVAIEFTSDLKEDALFNILNEEHFEIGGVRVDINPIRKEETGTLGEYLKQAERTIAENHERKQSVQFGLLAEQETQDEALEKEIELITAVRGGAVAKIEEKSTDVSSSIPVENARANKISNIRLVYNNESGFHLIADTDKVNDAIITVFGQNEPEVRDYLSKNAVSATIERDENGVTYNTESKAEEEERAQSAEFSESETVSEYGQQSLFDMDTESKAQDEPVKLKDLVIDLTPRSEREVQRTEISAETAEKHDFVISDEHLGEGGQKSKYAANIAAIKVLKAVESENRLATPAEQETLSKYVGWGGIPQAFDENNQQWKNEYIELKKLLTDEEYTSARASTPNAHYTSPEVIKAIYKGLENLGFEGGNVLEPAMGVGNFFGVMPEKIRANSRLKGIELDSISGRIAQQLYQSADIQIRGFEKTDFSDNYFDAAIGNVPFGNYGVADKRYDKEHFLIHDYFFAKTLDKVAPNGIIAFVTSKGTLDKANPSAREYIAKRADLIGAIRLPNNAFKGNANTEVTTDIIFLQKREKMAVVMPDWCYTSKNSDGIPVNNYFLDHPEMILGKMEFSEKMYGNTNDTTCTPIEGAVLSEQLEKAVSRLHAEHIVQKREEKSEKERGIIPATDDVRNFTFGLVDGEMYYRENNIMTKVRETGTKLERMKGMHELRNTMRTLITTQYEGCNDEQLAAIQSELNRKYDDYVKQFGSINSSPNRTVFSDDDDYNTLSALENVNPETKAVEKSDIFYKRTIKPNVEITKAENEQEAMQISLDLKGRLDIPYMAELCGKSAEEICNQLTLQELAYVNPEKYNPDKPFEGYEDAAEYLSGNIREKLRTAQTAAKNNEMFARNVAALEKALPPTITAGEITARIGVPWVDTSDYTQFLREYAKANISESIIRTYSGEYKVPKTYDCSIAATSTYGTKRMRSYDIFENLLNNRNCIVHDRIRDEKGNEKYVVNRKETELASAKAREMKDAFKRWLWEEPARREKYVTRYNELFNSIVGREYDGSHQSFPQMSPSINLNPHQKDAIMRAKFGGNTLLAHCVGAGKSFEMVATTMEKKRLGLINKACVVVPKHLVGQMAAEWMRLYPQAHILTATEKDFTKDKRQKFIGRCCTGNYDAVIMSYQQFEKIPMSTEYRARFLQNELTKVEFGLKETRASNGSPISIKDFEKQKKRIQAIIEKLLNAKEKDNSLCFEELGFDALIVDEAHNYKNGLVVTKMSNVAGVQSTPAQKSEDILMKTQWLNENHNGNIIFATGTPVSNSMVELYTMQQYLRPDLLHNAGLQNFDDWSSTFGEVISQLEMKPTGDGYRTKNRFARFANLPELMAMYKEFADIRTAEMLKLPVPEIVGGKPQTIKAEPNEFQKAYMQVLSNRADAIQNKLVEPTEDNMLKITNEARLLGLDARCINPDAENTPNSKVNLCIDKIMEIYNKTTEQKGVQAVFCDIAVNADDGKFSVYDYIKEELQRRGIPKEEICTAADAKDQKQREEMYAELRSGTKRIVIASTSKMGTGANIQTRLAALHHLDIPWKPSDLEQRNGRILRQGNTFKQVEIYNYVTEGTFDAYMMNIIVNKQKFISQLMSGKTPARTCEDVDEAVLNYSEIQAIASGDTRIKEKIELDNEVSRLHLLESEYYNKKYELEDSAAKLPAIIERKKASLENAKSDKAFAETNKLPENTFAITIDGTKYTERKDAGAALSRELVSAVAKKEYKEIGEYCGFKVFFTFSGLSIPYISLKKDSLSYTTTPDLGNDLGNIVRLENVLKLGIDKTIKSLEESIARDERDLNEALATKDAPFEYAEELAKKSARLEQLNNELDVGKAEEIALNDDNDEQKIDRKPPKHNL